MDDLIFLLARAIQTGGPLVIICFLLANLAYFMWLSQKLSQKLEEKYQEMKLLIENTNEVTKLFSEALNDVKCLIAEIKGSIK